MTRKERHSRSSGARKRSLGGNAGNEPRSGDDNGAKLPPRRKKFPSSIHNVYKWYYNLLFILFLGLVAFLFWYGNKFSS
ncbi:hypothetical protein RB620_02330 [Paenibacillus sp. LHD-117]|uniref:hypothetical protein n=1 Tax=Paenibacillus sp. LHD-117 TaxID=3071412 RepID=UPI0027E1C3F9|nr:hypothetical protein [Paenibacillus sp. LHD-117]MDQ6418266.1 hypothetical protein [Paenibacillus sp. LHD-117]